MKCEKAIEKPLSYCKRCNRKLTSKESIEREMGKVCFQKLKELEIKDKSQRRLF